MMQKTGNSYWEKTIVLAVVLFAGYFLPAQQPDSLIKLTPETTAVPVPVEAKKDTTVKKHSPRTAAIRSAILPGLGQIYNKKYWKLPIVYGAIGISGGVFFYNLKNYKDTRFAYKVKYNMRVNRTDSALFSSIKPALQPLSEESLRFYRDQFRRDVDYSALFFIILWGLNVVDATVDAHLKSFDVSPDLSLRIKPGHSEMAGTNGISLVLSLKDKRAR
jgi:Family of unknown function (DUF5683)